MCQGERRDRRWGIPCPLHPRAAQRDLTVPDVRLRETEAGLVCCTAARLEEYHSSPVVIMAQDPTAG